MRVSHCKLILGLTPSQIDNQECTLLGCFCTFCLLVDPRQRVKHSYMCALGLCQALC